MIALEVADLVRIATRTLGLDTGQVLDLLDAAAAEHALAQARPVGDQAAAAAALLHALLRQRPLRRGNQQLALAAMLQFLALNGQDMEPDPPGPVAAMVTQLAAGALGTQDAADWLAPRLRARPKGKFTRFTDRARRVVLLAQDEARELGHGSIGPEHLLLGLLVEGDGVAAVALESLGVSLEEARDQVKELAVRGQGKPAGSIPFTLPARKVLERALREALQLGHTYIGTEHLLLSLLSQGDGIPAQVLAGRGADYALVRQRVVALLTGRSDQADPNTRLVRLPVSAGLADVTEHLRQVQRQKTAAFEAGDLDNAAALRDRQRQLRAEKLRLEQEWAAGVDVQAVIAGNQRVHRELDRLRDLLRQHGIEPDGGTARTA